MSYTQQPQQPYPQPQQPYPQSQQPYPQAQPMQGNAPPPYTVPAQGQGQSPPGYVTTSQQPPPGVQQPTFVTQTTVTTNNNQSSIRMAIPELPMVLAVILCVVNCLLPGIGTIIAGFSVLCCGNVGQSGGGRFGTFCINFWVGICQILTLLFFVGWIWSIMWGVAFIAISAEAHKKQVITTTTTTVPGQVVVQQPPPTTTYSTSNPQAMPIPEKQ